MSIRKLIFVGFAVIHLTLIFVQNVAQNGKTYLELYYPDDTETKEISTALDGMIYGMSYVDKYMQISGLNTGYGFYAPQVCAHIEPFFQVYEGEETILAHHNISLTTAESHRRFNTVFTRNLERVDDFLLGNKCKEELSETIEHRIMDLKMHALSTRIINELGRGDKVESALYLYQTANVESFCDKKLPLGPSFQRVMNYEYKIN